MNFKRYHESKNLFDPNSTRYHMGKGTNNKIDSVANGAMFYIKAEPNTAYTIKNHTTDSTFVRLYLSNAPIVENVRESYNVISESETTINPEATISNTDYAYLWIQTGGTWYTEHGGSSIMLNTGSQPLPYEPYDDTWYDIPHYIHNTSTDTLTTLPADIYANDTTATVGLKGQMEQSGTPTPDNPIQPQECGERTENLFDKNSNDITNQRKILSDGTVAVNPYFSITGFIPIKPDTYYSQGVENSGTSAFNAFYDENKNFISSFSATGVAPHTAKSPVNAAYIRLSLLATNSAGFQQSMLVEGSSLPSDYVPYGYKIPISSANTTTPVYLGEVQSMRRIKKLVLTGTEDWRKVSDVAGFYTTITDTLIATNSADYIKSSHYQSSMSGGNGTIRVPNNANRVLIFDNYSTADDFKIYLQQQYSAGTPVCVWYVLAEPTTGILNEPLRNIGDYADEVSGVSIPTIAGANTLSVDTTLQPSEVTVNYKGWHPVADVHERENGEWD